MKHLDWKWQQVEGATVLVLAGELDRGSAASVRAQLHAAASGEQHVIVDLGQLRFIDSSGIKELLDANRAVMQSRRKFALVVSSPALQKIFHIVGVDQVLPVLPTVDDAVKTVTAGEAG